VILDLRAPFAVVCHDAGAANHILEWVALEAPECRPFMTGPAADLWRRRFPARPSCASLEEALRGARSVLSGTGWGSDVEHVARQRARETGLHSVAVIDHWVNYQARFERHGSRELPGEVWVTDPWAASIARRSFPGLRVVEKPNAYLEAVVREVASSGAPTSGTLFVLEPVRDDWGRGEPGEFQSLDYFLSRRAVLGGGAGEEVRLRPHPSDPPGKYDAWLARHAGEGVRMDDSATLSEALSRTRRVVGIQTFALVVAAAAGRQAVSALPPWGPALCLPQPQILELRRLCGDA
jgi:hypothetical protein